VNGLPLILAASTVVATVAWSAAPIAPPPGGPPPPAPIASRGELLRFSREILDREALDAIERLVGGHLDRTVALVIRDDYLSAIADRERRFAEAADLSQPAIRQFRRELVDHAERVWDDVVGIIGDAENPAKAASATSAVGEARRAWLRRQWLDAPRAAHSFFSRGIDLVAFVRSDPLTARLLADAPWPERGGDGPDEQARRFTAESLRALLTEYEREMTEAIERVRTRAIDLDGPGAGRRRYALAGETYALNRAYAERVVALLRQSVAETAVLLWTHRFLAESDPMWFGELSTTERAIFSAVDVDRLALGGEPGPASLNAMLRSRWEAAKAIHRLQVDALRGGRPMMPTPDDTFVEAMRALGERLDEVADGALRQLVPRRERDAVTDSSVRWEVWFGREASESP